MVDTMCFIPCCKRKTAAPDRQATGATLTRERIPDTWRLLQAGRHTMSPCIEGNSRPCRALLQYDGGLYNAQASFRDDIARGLNAGRLDLYILSAGYGLVHALDPIRPYEAEMKGRVATMWRDAGLPEVIAELICASRARRAFGFFAGPAHWSGPMQSTDTFSPRGSAERRRAIPPSIPPHASIVTPDWEQVRSPERSEEPCCAGCVLTSHRAS